MTPASMPHLPLIGKGTSPPEAGATELASIGLTVTLDGVVVLSPLHLQAKAGEWVVLIGPNGAGKSSALRAMSGILTTHGRSVTVGGSVQINGEHLHRLKSREIGQRIAVVPQSPVVPPGVTVFDYVLLGRTPHLGWLGRPGTRDRQLVGEMLARLDLQMLSERMIDSLSGGERQRAVIARALAQQAPVLLLDEPTSALDVGHQQQVLELVDELRKQDGLIIVSAMHDLTLAGQYAHHLVLLSGGESVLTGRPRDVLADDVLAQTYGARLKSVHLGNDGVAVFPVRAS
jgi:iron complex transport system ATP-binding protein